MTDDPTTSPVYQRRLYYVPILHTAIELGGLLEGAKEIAGEQAFSQRQRVVSAIWDRVEEWAQALDPSLPHFKLYQDGLAQCGKELQIVQELAERKSRNHRLLLELVGRGASLIGTEDPALLVREYELAKQIVTPNADRAALEPVAIQLLAERDAFIAERINQTLLPGQTGVLFIGMLHNVHRNLAPDIELVVPFTKV